MNRRDVLRTLAAGATAAVAGCFGETMSGSVARNETRLSVEHDHSFFATTRYEVSVTLTNTGSVAIEPGEQLPKVECAFQNGAGERLHLSERLLKQPIPPADPVEMVFQLFENTGPAKQYALSLYWQDRSAE